jgi:FKBP-type peptidyl-prolyl cis-trans isomerase FkpA
MRFVPLAALLLHATAVAAGESQDAEAAAVPPADTATATAPGVAEPAASGGAAAVPPVAMAIPGPELRVEDLRVGAGIEAVVGSGVAVHYTGWLEDRLAPDHKGRQFDSSRGRNPLVIPLGAGRVIKGWDVGLPGMKVGGIRRLTIPPELGYGPRAVGGGVIPGNSTLIFEVELLGVESVRDLRGVR